MTDGAPARAFWRTMQYACDRCGRRFAFRLEDGCEGPRGGGSQAHTLPADHPFDPGGVVQWDKTPSGRLIVPVPFVAAGCPDCQGEPPWSLAPGAGVLQHVDWKADAEHRPMLVESALGQEEPRFHYPADPTAAQACGEPILPATLSRRRG